MEKEINMELLEKAVVEATGSKPRGSQGKWHKKVEAVCFLPNCVWGG